MDSFFSRIKNMLSSDYGGRYIELILKEVILEDLSILKIIFPKLDQAIITDRRNIQVDVEDIFPGIHRSSRRADLTVRHKGQHIALLEIKYHDQSLDMQIEDYLQYAKKNGLCFTYLTQHIPEQGDLRNITAIKDGRYRHLLFADLFRMLTRNRHANNQSGVRKLFYDFMEENFMMYADKFDQNYEDALILLLIKGLYVRHNAGFKRKVSANNIGAIPDLWSSLIGNVTVLGDRFYNDFPKYFNNRFSADFGFDPLFNLTLVRRDLKLSDDEDYLDRRRKIGGNFFICANGKIKQSKRDDYLYISLGYSFDLDLNDKKLRKYLISSVCGKGIDIKEAEREFKTFPSEEKCYHNLLSLAVGAIHEVLIDNKKIFPPFKKSLTALKKDIVSRLHRD